MENFISKIEQTIDNASNIRVSINANGNRISTVFDPVEIIGRPGADSDILCLLDWYDNELFLNCRNVDYDEICGFFVLGDPEVEVTVEFAP